jgi:hypothetical protein
MFKQANKIAVQAAVIGVSLCALNPAWAAGKTEDQARKALQPAVTQPTVMPAPGSYLIDFENLAVGATVGAQYSAWGVSFSANAYGGSDSPNAGWATNTDMTIVAVGGGDTGGLGGPSLVSGNLLRSFAGWQAETGDPSFLMSFDAPISSISVDFAGVAFSTAGTYVTTVFATTTGQMTLSYTGSNIGFVGVTPGDFNDWVGVDNIRYTVAAAVPEPETYGLLALGLGVIGVVARRRKA